MSDWERFNNHRHDGFYRPFTDRELLVIAIGEILQLRGIVERMRQPYVATATMSFKPKPTNGGSSMQKAYQLLATAIATLVLLDAAGKDITKNLAAGTKVAWSSSNESFAKVTPATDDFGGLTAAIEPQADTTGALVTGSAVITATITNPDETQVVLTGVVADTDDVATGSITFAPAPVQT